MAAPRSLATFGGMKSQDSVTVVITFLLLLPWLWRFALATAIGQAIRTSGWMTTVPGFFAACALIALIYILLLLPLFFQEPLAEYTRPLMARLTARRPIPV